MIPPPYINLAAQCEWIPYNGVAVGPACPPMRPPPPPHPTHLAPGPRPMHSTPGAHLRSGLSTPKNFGLPSICGNDCATCIGCGGKYTPGGDGNCQLKCGPDGVCYGWCP